MDAANALSSSLAAQTTVSAATTATTVSEVAITNTSVQQPSTTVSVSQGQVQTDLSQTSQDAVGPTVQLKIMIEQTIVQFLGQLDKLFAKPQAVADFLPESIRQDMQQILSNQLLAATPETFEQGFTAMVKTNKDTADAFSQLAKGLNGALTFQDKLPETAQNFLQTARPLLTDLLNQTKSDINRQLGQQPVNQNNGSIQQSALIDRTVVATAATTTQSAAIPQQGMVASATTGTFLPQPIQVVTQVSMGMADTSPTTQQEVPLTDTAAPVLSTAAADNLISKAPRFIEGQLSEAAVTDDEISGGIGTQQLATDLVVKQEQTLSAGNRDVTPPISQTPSFTASQLLTVATDDETLGALPSQLATSKAATVGEFDSQLLSQSTAQAVISNILLLNNNPNVPAGPVGVDEFFNWIAQEFRQSQDKPALQENLQQKIDVWSAPLSQLSESDSNAFNEIRRQLEQQLPSQLKSIATELPALKDLYIYNKMSDLAKYANLSQDKLFAAKESISRLAESFQKSLVDSLSFHSETGSSGKVLTFFMPLAFDGTTTFPAHIHIYHQNQPEKRGGPSVAETWLRIFLKTDYSGTVTLLFHVRQQAVDMKLGFSDKRAAQDFYAWLPDIRQSLANSSFTLQDIQVMSA
jgi:hypothetical protein